MSEGILRNPDVKALFENINKRSICSKCKSDRIAFADMDKKHNESYSNLIPGFSSSVVRIPLKLLIVAEAHGGGRKDMFRNQRDLKKELVTLEDYYINGPITKFHQAEMRKLFFQLNENNISWIFTDLIKCFVWQGKDENLKGKKMLM